MAAGVGATFGAPIGGTMLAIELMSTYYYIHWFPMALYCSVMGYYFVEWILPADAQAYFTVNDSIRLDGESIWTLFTFALLGALCGVVGAVLVKFTVSLFRLRRKYLGKDFVIRTSIFLAVFAIIHSFVIDWVGGILARGGRASVIDLFNDHTSNHSRDAKWLRHGVQLFDNPHWNESLALFFAMLVKFVLTGISLVLPVPAGTFMPIFQIGSLFGRSFGEFCVRFPFVTWVDPRATAIVGAASVATGALHTTSIAIVMLELTREAVDVLPLCVGVISSYAVSKHLCSDLFSELIRVRRLPFILGLRERYPEANVRFFERVAAVSAENFMLKEFPYVTPSTTAGQVRELARLNPALLQSGLCAFLSNETDRHLWGTVHFRMLYDKVNKTESGSVSETSSPVSTRRSTTPSPQAGQQAQSFATPPWFESGGGSAGPSNASRVHNDRPVFEVQVPASTDTVEYGTFTPPTIIQVGLADSDLVPFLADFDPTVGDSHVDMAPMQVTTQTPFWKVSQYFSMLGMTSMYVMRDGATVGMLTKTHVINYTFGEEDRELEEREVQRREKQKLAEIIRLTQAREKPGAASTSRGSMNRIASQFSQADLINFAKDASRPSRHRR